MALWDKLKTELDRMRQHQMAHDGQCMLEAPEPISLDKWALGEPPRPIGVFALRR